MIVGASDVIDGYIDIKTPKLSEEAQSDTRVAPGVPEEGDLLFTRAKPVGEVGMVPAGSRVSIDRHLVLLKPNRQRVLGEFLRLHL